MKTASVRNPLQMLRNGIAPAALALALLAAVLVRSSGNFFHTEGFTSDRPTISAPCNACDLEATGIIHAPPPPALPPLTISEHLDLVPAEAQPFSAPALSHRGRAPPCA